jgi:hypothetical protein
VARHLDPAPFARELAFAVEDEGAALDAADFLPVHALQLHDAELLAERLVGVRQQLERELDLGLEGLVGFQRVVFGIEIQDQRLAACAGEGEGAAAGGRKAELADRLACCFQSCLGLL